jgi:hypothetical protein
MTLTLAAAVGVVVLVPGRAVRSPGVSDATARGGEVTSALLVYRMRAGAPPVLATNEIAADDELAFAYANPRAKPFLSIFGASESGRVYWYYPAWPKGAPAPTAVPARAGSGPHELPEAVQHEIEGRRLDVYAVYSDEPLGVTVLESAVGRRTSDGDLPLSAGTIAVKRSFKVAR